MTKYITFICDQESCNNERTIYKSTFDRYDSHYCCRDCYTRGNRGYKNALKVTTKKINRRKEIANEIREYFRKVYND